MNVYDVILQAAHVIEKEPYLFSYRQSRVRSCGSPACAIGWIGFCAGETELEKSEGLDDRTERLLGVDYWCTFEHRMSELDSKWNWSAANCATTLRAYAAKYHAPTKRTDA